MKTLALVTFLLASQTTFAMTKTFCGKLSLEGWKAQLIRNSEVILDIGARDIFSSINEIVKLEDKGQYCVKAEVDFAVSLGIQVTYVPVKVLDAYSFFTKCGVYEGNYLLGNIVLSQKNLEDANKFVTLNDRGQRGLNAGLKYCLDLKRGADKVIYGYEYRTYCGTLTVIDGSTYLLNPKRNAELIIAVKGGSQKLVKQAMSLLDGSFTEGSAYCLDARLHERGWEAEIIGAREI